MPATENSIGAGAIALRVIATLLVLGMVAVVVLLAVQVSGHDVLWHVDDGSTPPVTATTTTSSSSSSSTGAPISPFGSTYPLGVTETGRWNAAVQVGSGSSAPLGVFDFVSGRATFSAPIMGVLSQLFTVQLARRGMQIAAIFDVTGVATVTLPAVSTSGATVTLRGSGVTVTMTKVSPHGPATVSPSLTAARALIGAITGGRAEAEPQPIPATGAMWFTGALKTAAKPLGVSLGTVRMIDSKLHFQDPTTLSQYSGTYALPAPAEATIDLSQNSQPAVRLALTEVTPTSYTFANTASNLTLLLTRSMVQSASPFRQPTSVTEAVVTFADSTGPVLDAAHGSLQLDGTINNIPNTPTTLKVQSAPPGGTQVTVTPPSVTLQLYQSVTTGAGATAQTKYNFYGAGAYSVQVVL